MMEYLEKQDISKISKFDPFASIAEDFPRITAKLYIYGMIGLGTFFVAIVSSFADWWEHDEIRKTIS